MRGADGAAASATAAQRQQQENGIEQQRMLAFSPALASASVKAVLATLETVAAVLHGCQYRHRSHQCMWPS